VVLDTANGASLDRWGKDNLMGLFTYKSTINFSAVADHLARYCGIKKELSSKRLHKIKEENGFPGDRNVVFDFSGTVYDPDTLEIIGSLTAGGAGEVA